MDTAAKELVSKAIEILRNFGATEVYLFGSAKREDFDPLIYDFDLAVRGIAPEKFYRAVGETLCTLGREVDIIDLDAVRHSADTFPNTMSSPVSHNL